MTGETMVRAILGVAVVVTGCLGRQAPVADPAYEKGLELSGPDASEDDMKEARSCFETSCASGHGAGCFHLAVMWERGMGGHEDQDHALDLLRRGCDLGESKACSLLNARLTVDGMDGGGTSATWP